MPTFDTPTPISVSLDLPAGDVRLVGTDRTDTVVDVLPAHASSKADVRAAEQTEIEYDDGRLVIRVPRQPGLFGRNGAVRVTIALPAGSDVAVEAASGDVRGEGRLGECRLKTASGDVRLDETGPVRVDTASGDITLDRAVGDVSVTVHSGDVRIREIDGSAVVRTTSGDIRLGRVTDSLRISGANGDVAVDGAGGDVAVRIASGDVRVADVVRGSVQVETASGDLTVGIREGTAAWLDVNSVSGSVRNGLTAADTPDGGERTVEVRARTLSGDITIRRSTAPTPV